MSNMSYCRFRNTLGDLLDCKDALSEGALRDKKMDDEERRAMLTLISTCQEIVEDFGEEAGVLDEEDDEEESN